MNKYVNIEDIEYGDVFSIADVYEIPASVTIEVNTFCNLYCKHCYIPGHSCAQLSFETIENILHELRELGTFEIVLTGGEIFCRNDALHIIKLARNLGFDVIIFSNATMIDESIARQLSELYIGLFSTSIYSMSEDIHDGITGCMGSLKKTIHGLSLLKKYCIPVEVKTMVMRDNYNEINEIHSFCMENGYGYVASPYIFCQTDNNKKPLDLRVASSHLKKVIPVINKIVDFQPCEKKDEDYMCSSIQHSFGIDASGNVYPCNAMFYKVGNINQESIQKIWYSDNLRKIRKLKNKDLYDCRGCDKAEFCIRCAGIALGENGDMLSKFSYACEVANVRYQKRNEN